MPVTNYHTLNGELLGETGPGGRRFYGKDALGSVVATYDQNGTLENTYRYKPYGGLLSKTGSAPDPRFMWTGSTGSRTTGASYAEQYNRARHYGSRQAGWTSVDPLWPLLPPFAYSPRPITAIDPYGLSPCENPCSCQPEHITKKWHFRYQFPGNGQEEWVQRFGLKVYIAWQHERQWSKSNHCDYEHTVVTAIRFAVIDRPGLIKKLCEKLVASACETACKAICAEFGIPPPISKLSCSPLCEALQVANLCDHLPCYTPDAHKYEFYNCCNEKTSRICPHSPRKRSFGIQKCGHKESKLDKCVHLAPSHGNYAEKGGLTITC